MISTLGLVKIPVKSSLFFSPPVLSVIWCCRLLTHSHSIDASEQTTPKPLLGPDPWPLWNSRPWREQSPGAFSPVDFHHPPLSPRLVLSNLPDSSLPLLLAGEAWVSCGLGVYTPSWARNTPHPGCMVSVTFFFLALTLASLCLSLDVWEGVSFSSNCWTCSFSSCGEF